jgi:lysophospholipase L1-like esterase
MPSLVRRILNKLGFSGYLPPEPDPLPEAAWWQAAVAAQAHSLQDRSLDFLWLGDSITSGLGPAWGDREVGTAPVDTERGFNAALSGMTTTSLVIQLQQLSAVNLQVGQVVIAMGTNDADRAITPIEFCHNLTAAIELIQGLGAHRIDLLPAHFPTPGYLWHYGWPDALTRVQQLNQQLAQVAQTFADSAAAGESQLSVIYHPQFFSAMYSGHRVEPALTTDGVHLNAQGCQVYRQLLLALMTESA